ncbi:vegetative cell wall protein gp1-like [Iris pallida]|uniref:Vegetative cell wall protein gp1-like n=1 Tax=Iris pallida TaxID=29817 RepID=A0AAX6EFU3_IRIPA|nr:vegetative cell wall protein gp1-like [Iris pallida]KAJ6811505.1 vegetative cell wall protein gp1-like [Iris pallida]
MVLQGTGGGEAPARGKRSERGLDHAEEVGGGEKGRLSASLRWRRRGGRVGRREGSGGSTGLEGTGVSGCAAGGGRDHGRQRGLEWTRALAG